jgi:PIN domain
MMNAHVRDCLVTGYEPLIETLELPDPDDRHVLAAAITAHADLIVTKNLDDFPAARLASYGIEVRHPDTFVRNLLELDEESALAAVAEHRASLQNPRTRRSHSMNTSTHSSLRNCRRLSLSSASGEP